MMAWKFQIIEKLIIFLVFFFVVTKCHNFHIPGPGNKKRGYFGMKSVFIMSLMLELKKYKLFSLKNVIIAALFLS
jgi:hypothetical protein